jgi:hypothetical protein
MNHQPSQTCSSQLMSSPLIDSMFDSYHMSEEFELSKIVLGLSP